MQSDILNQKLATDKFEIFWLEENVLYMRLFSNKIMTVEDIKTMHQLQAELGLCAHHKRLVHAEEFSNIDSGAREYVQENAIRVVAEAYILTSLSQRIIFNFYSKLKKNSNPSKAFCNIDDALTWLRSF